MAVQAGQEILAGLIEKADVLIDNFKLGTLEKWGFTDAWLDAARAARRPLLDHRLRDDRPEGGAARLRLHPAGRVGADEHLRRARRRARPNTASRSSMSAPACWRRNAILAALNARHRTGKGQHVEVSLFDTSLAMLINVASNYLSAGRNGGRFGNGHPSIVPYTTYHAKDGMIAVAVGNDAQFARFAEVLGHPEWAQDPRFNSNRARVENRERSTALINEALSHDAAETWLGKLEAVGIPCGKINSVAEALDDPHTAARRMVETVEHPVIGTLKMLGIPFKFSDTACSVRRPPPTLGQHSDEILSSELGLDATAIAELRRDKIV